MNKSNQFPIEFQAIKKPISGTLVHTFDQNEGLGVGWQMKDIGKATIIRDNEKHDFLMETKDLIYGIGLQNLSVKDKLAHIVNQADSLTYNINDLQYKPSDTGWDFTAYGSFAAIMQYYNKWGSLIPLPPDKYRISFHELSYYCLAGILWTELWTAINEQTCSPSMQVIINDFFKKIQNISNPPRYWSMVIYSETGQINWKPTSKKTFDDKATVPWIIIRHPKKEVFLRERFSWFKEEIARSVLNYYSLQGKAIAYSPKIIGNALCFKASTENKFLVWVLETIKSDELKKVKLCECGCGQELTGKAQRWATAACKQRVKNQSPEKRITAWLRTRKNRGLITEEGYETLRLDVKAYLKEDYSEEWIRGYIKEKLGHNN